MPQAWRASWPLGTRSSMNSPSSLPEFFAIHRSVLASTSRLRFGEVVPSDSCQEVFMAHYVFVSQRADSGYALTLEKGREEVAFVHKVYEAWLRIDAYGGIISCLHVLLLLLYL